MTKTIAIAALLTLLAPAARAAEPWEGLWLEEDRTCSSETAASDGIRITATEMETAIESCRTARTSRLGKTSWRFSLRCSLEGQPVNITQTVWMLGPDRMRIRDGSGGETVLHRCESVGSATNAATLGRRKMMGCEGERCRYTAVEWHNVDTVIAWAVGQPNVDDAEQTCEGDLGLAKGSMERNVCVAEQLMRPSIKIAADCEHGSTSVDGERYRVTDAGRDGAVRADEDGFWDTRPPYAAPSAARIAMLATWYRVLCPATGPKFAPRSGPAAAAEAATSTAPASPPPP